MTERTCSVEGCARHHSARDLCHPHYSAALRSGELIAHRRKLAGSTVEEKLRQNHAVSPEGCWRWTGSHTPKGYGSIKADGRTRQIHRVAYELWVGAIPAGLTIDHVRTRGCVHRDCINPSHLEAVPFAVNRSRTQRPKDGWRTGSPRKVSDEGVRSIRRQVANGVSTRIIAVEFGITRHYVNQLASRRKRSDVA